MRAKARGVTLLVAVFTGTLVGQNTNTAPSTIPEREVSWGKMIPNLASDQKQIWTFPVKLAHGKHWIPVAAVVGTTAALVALDPHTAPYFRRTSAFDGFNHVFTGQATSIAIAVPPVAMYAAGLIRKDPKMQSTALLAGEAFANVEILTTVMKDIDRRLRPIDVPLNGDFSHTWFQDDHHNFRSNGSFPSGHTIAAFAIATVIARRYGKQARWVPYVAYGGAALVGFSRLTLSAHFASDVFMGAALGYSVSRFTVLRQ